MTYVYNIQYNYTIYNIWVLYCTVIITLNVKTGDIVTFDFQPSAVTLFWKLNSDEREFMSIFGIQQNILQICRLQNRMRITHKSRQKTLGQNISRGLVCKIHKPCVRHVTGNDQDYLRKIPRAVVQISALL